MLAAYLRGLLQPEHTYGRASQVREALVFSAIESQNHADVLKQVVTVNTAFAATTSSKNRAGAYDALYDKVFAYKSALEFSKPKPVKAVSTDTNDLVSTYGVYEETGVLDALQKLHADIDKDL
jgi:hypothetical protein